MTAAGEPVLTPGQITSIRERFFQVGCAQLADAAPDYVRPVRLPLVARNGRQQVCGPVVPAVTANDMLPCLQGLADTPAGWVLFIHNTSVPSEAIVGDVFLTSAEVQGLGGVVVDGAVRDIADLEDIDVPLFSTDVTFVSARTTNSPADPGLESVRAGDVVLRRGDWLFGDRDGFLMVPAERAAAVVTAGAVLRRREEGLKSAMRQQGQSLAELSNLAAFLDGTGELGYVP